MTAERAVWPLSRAAMLVCLWGVVQGCSGSPDKEPENPNLAAGFHGSGGASGSAGSANAGSTQTVSTVAAAGGSMGFGGAIDSSTTTRTSVTGTVGGDTSTGTGSSTGARTTIGGAATAMGGTSAARTQATSGGMTTGGNTGGDTGIKTGAGSTSVGGGGSSPMGSGGTRTASASGGTITLGGSSGAIGSGGVTPMGGSSNGTGGKTASGGTAQCPGSSTLKAGDNKSSLQFGGRSRSYVVYLPSSVKAGTRAPLIFDFHGHGGNGTQEESSSGWKQKADQNGFIMVYPDGVDSSWNVGNCCGQALSENVDDVGFTRAILEAVSRATCIDPKRVYATGMSNGAGFTHRLACEAADVIAAIAAASADLVTDPCTPARPISELSIRGLSDTTVAYAGGNTGSTGWYSPGAKKTLDLWKAIDQCTGAATTSLQYCEGYTSCATGVEIALCSLPNTGHDTYNNAVGFKVPDVAWEMFQRQPMP